MNTRSFLALLAFTLLALLALAGAGEARGADTFALVVLGNGQLRRLNLTQGTHSLIRDNSGVYAGLAFNADQTILYGVITPGRTTPSTLVRLNPMTGLPTPVGPVGVAISTMASLSDGRLLAVGYDNSLYQINPNTGAATPIGPTGLPSLVSGTFANSLASDGAVLYYTLYRPTVPTLVTSVLFRLDLATGTATPIGSTGTDRIAGSAFAGPTFALGRLHGFRSNGEIYAIDLATGLATYVSDSNLSDIYGGVGIINVVPPTVTLADYSGCLGEGVTLIPTVGGSGLFTYRWRRNGVNIPGETSATLGNIRASDNYSVVVCNEGGCTTSREARVSIFQGPYIAQQPPPSITACVGTPVSMNVVVALGALPMNGGGALGALPSTFFQWTKNGQPVPGATSGTLFIASAQPSDAGTYRVVVNDSGCAVTSAPCVLTVTGSALGAEFTEGNAAEWCAFASDAAATSLANDPTRVRSGQYSLRLDTDSGFDTGVRFPCEPTAHWDLRGHNYLEFWSYAENPWPSGFQGNQPVIVLRTATGVFQYEPPDRLTTNNAWSHFRVPLAGDSFWRRTATNYPTLGDVNQIEIHQDTWDYGFVIYYDGLRFTRESECSRLRLEPPLPLGNDRYRLTLARVDGVPFYTNSPPVVDLRASARIAAPWNEWLSLPTSSLRVEDGRLVVEHTSLSPAQFYFAADRSALRFDVPTTTNFGGLGLLPGKFVYPQGMSIGAGGELHVVDDTGGGVQVFDKDTLLFKRRYATNLFYPNDVAVDAAGYSYVSEYGDTIGVYAPDGSWLRTLNLGMRSWPDGLTIDPTSGNLVVASASTESARISVWTPGGTLVRSWAPATGAEDVWVSAAGEVFASGNEGIYRYSNTGALLGQFVPRHRAAALCGDDTGILYVTYFDHESVDAYSLTGELQATYEMMACALDAPYSGFTFGVTYSGPNQLFVTDRATHKVARLKIVRQRCSDCGW